MFGPLQCFEREGRFVNHDKVSGAQTHVAGDANLKSNSKSGTLSSTSYPDIYDTKVSHFTIKTITSYNT